MKKFIIAISLIAVLFLAGCIQKQAPEHSFNGIDCGNNVTCFSENLAKCNPAKIEIKQNINGMDTVFYSDIQGGTPDKCEIYQQIKSIEFPENISPVEKITRQVLIGADSTCIGPVTKLKTGSFEEYMEYFNCSGTLYDLMKAGYQQVENTSEEKGRKTLNPTLS